MLGVGMGDRQVDHPVDGHARGAAAGGEQVAEEGHDRLTCFGPLRVRLFGSLINLLGYRISGLGTPRKIDVVFVD